ncbi:MAG: hypothetical protein ACOZBL_01725 [Patescibacteria group bacterium]
MLDVKNRKLGLSIKALKSEGKDSSEGGEKKPRTTRTYSKTPTD